MNITAVRVNNTTSINGTTSVSQTIYDVCKSEGLNPVLICENITTDKTYITISNGSPIIIPRDLLETPIRDLTLRQVPEFLDEVLDFIDRLKSL